MAQSSWPFENIDTTETQYSQLFRTLNNGVNGTPDGGELEVGPASAGLAVDIAAGQAMVRGHFYSSTEVETRTLAVADSSNDRIDLVVLRLDPIANTIVLAVKTGVPDPAPVAPALVQTDGGIFEQPLANVLVPAEAGVPSTITDRREFMGTKLGTWTTDGRPVPAGRVLFGFNTTLEAVEFYDPINEVWGPVAPEINSLDDIGDVTITTPLTGQSLVYNGTNWVNAFANYEVEYLVVAGGGGGGEATSGAGGGGAGGLLTDTLSLTIGSYSLTVGGGGNGGAGTETPGTQGAGSVFNTVTTVGGGFGQGNHGQPGGNGGSGGGGAGGASGSPAGGSGTVGPPRQGFDGGAGRTGTNRGGGGGGGAGEVGESSPNSAVAGSGGDGLELSITGSNVYYAGGGGGSRHNIVSAGRAAGGLGGGGYGGGDPATNDPGEAGQANTGGGGGGGANAIGGNGGSGVVILKIAESATVTFSGGVTQTNATAGGFTVYSVTAAGPTDTVTIA